MSDSQSASAIALVMKLGANADRATVSRLASRLAGDNTTATWALSQVDQLAFLGTIKPALRGVAIDVATLGDVQRATEQLKALLAGNARVGSLLATESQVRRCVSLASESNLTAALVEDAQATGTRQAGPGLWRFAAGLEYPQAVSWPRLFGSSSKRKLSDLLESGATVVKVDLAQMAASTQGQRQVDRLLTKLAWAQQKGLQLVTLSELAELHSARVTVKPQRSILRAA